MFSIEKFNDFTFGRRTVVHTDHKPFESIFMKPLHRAPKRLQGMLIRLQKYDLVVQYERGSRMFLADTLSRAYLPSGAQIESEFETINMMNYLPISEARLLQIQRETEQDESLQVLKAVIQHGWSENKSTLPLLASPYFDMRDELSVQDGLIFKGERVVVPKAARSGLLKRIHNSHLGVNGCLNRARECLYWPGMTGDIKNYVSTCEACREYEKGQRKETLISHEARSRPWQFVAADLFELNGKSYLVTVDYFSDFFELDHLKSTSSVYVIKKLKGHFARHGIPEQLVTDNEPQFVSRDFLKFSKEWDFEHRTSSPYRSQSNGKAESAVKQAKKILLKCGKTGSDAFLALLDHRNTPPASMQISSAQRLFSRRTRSLLPMTAALLKPSVSDENVTHTKLHRRQQQQAKYYNRGARDLQPFEPGDTVRVEPWRAGRKEWQKGVVKSRIDKRSYEVELPQGLLRRNRVELRKSHEAPIKVEDDDVIEARKQSSTETREDTREQAPPDTRVETFD